MLDFKIQVVIVEFGKFKRFMIKLKVKHIFNLRKIMKNDLFIFICFFIFCFFLRNKD